ncbi:NitT/TauT family transport system ATP-binding protein [Propionibacterium cyclohexanicum]|uniref:NitT/TauT family transport system ATP-binding protein n=1 Tax=Propionibacterium cyclohexanicum TaxID=64702 RepID=A0A1H9RM59_9ACTN|nr:nitrate/sulfonate/bicarbonate ABC transporter ATP-binding protein [Propionibacterium cyclohexanicum]SER73822.1 NitT/TauT family transport system ATP-binding protein [Propionibacterium cyclohexanicum]
MTNQALIEVDDVTKAFPAQEGGTFTVLDHVDLRLEDGEILAILGKSGSGKSTLLRCIAGLIAPSEGTIRYRGAELAGANPGVGMVFQTFGLMPWLDVRENVELGLRARGVARAERTARAEELIDVIGLSGFENAYPRELSGGMRQRVGFARALVTQPDALLMDEPFSALDVLTAENLRTEIVRLWSEPDFPTKSICIVTHNIEEAVLLADRVVVLGSNPGRVRHETRIDLARPRERRSEAFGAYVDELYAVLTGQPVDPAAPATSPASNPLPQASVGGMAGLVSLVAGGPNGGDLADLAASLKFEVDDLLPLVDGATMLGLLHVDAGQAQVTDDGLAWVRSDIDEGKRLFGRLAAQRAPLVHAICAALDSSDEGTLRLDFFRDLLRRSFTREALEEQLATAIDWGRHGELFDLEPDGEVLSRG